MMANLADESNYLGKPKWLIGNMALIFIKYILKFLS